MKTENHTKITYICDKCGIDGKKNSTGPFFRGSLHFRKQEAHLNAGEDAFGAVAGNCDLCRYCAYELITWLGVKGPRPLAQWDSL